MNYRKILISSLLLVLSCYNWVNGQDRKSFNEDWLFLKEDAKGAETINFDHQNWRKLNLPHDWAIEGPFDIKYNARCGGLPVHGTAWYRKEFKMEPTDAGKVINVIFDGAMNDAHVWVNGEFVGNRPYGYVGFAFDISKYLKYDGSDNLIAVRLEPQDLSSRWYPGAGLYRNTWLTVDEPQHIPLWGTYITTPTVTSEKAVVQIETEIVNKASKKSEITVNYKISSPNGSVVAEISDKLEVEAGKKGKSSSYVNVVKPERWDSENPNLYTLQTEVVADGKITDKETTTFGIRSIKFDTEGFYLNGEKVRFNGVCLHHDNGPLGAALYTRADERKIEILKDMGVNAIRTSHNPPAPEFLEICDRLGMLVLDEAFDGWKIPKTENDYGLYFDKWAVTDLTDIIRRDRNHPSIVMWSVGNEILEQSDKQNGWRKADMLADVCRNVDPSRPSTIGFNYYPNPYDFNIAQQVDIAGVNYKPLHYSEIRKNYPQLIIYGSETSSCTSSRGVYHLPIEKYTTHESLQVTSYDIIGPAWAYPPDVEFDSQEKNSYVLGEFMWTGFDYLGEPTPYGGNDNFTNGYWNDHWPARSSYFGAVDLCGLPKDRFYLYQSQWSKKPMIHLLPHWNWEGMEGETIPVYAYTNCQEAELFVNGKSMGKKVKGKDLTEIKVQFLRYEGKTFMTKYRLSWEVPYVKGEIKVVGYNDGKAITEKVIKTAGKCSNIALSPDRAVIDADGSDLSYVTVRIEDKEGNICPNADNLVNFKVEGAGELIAVGNGDPTSTASFQADNRKAFSGMCMAIIKSKKGQSGEIKITATSKGLKSTVVVINSK
ncbi:MAG: beta-galactosidase GalB [Rikenellaceae bacterium]